MKAAQTFQTIDQRKPNRADHVWLYLKYRGHHKCVLCGAITPELPPPYPTDPNWLPIRYEKLTGEELVMCPERK